MSAETQPRVLARVPISVRWRDLDAYQHVNNSTFLTYLEEARLIWLDSLDGEWHGADFGPVLAASQVNYRAQLEWPGSVVVELSCQRLGNRSLSLGHRILDASGERLYSDGHVVMVWIDTRSGASIDLPAVVRAACI